MKFFTPNELISWTPPVQPWIIEKDILIDQGTMMIYGKEETWKSMMAGLDLSFRIAAGQPWFGFRTAPSPVAVFQTEIPQGALRTRMIKYMTGNKATSQQVYFGSELYMKIDKGWGFAELEQGISTVHPKVLIIDPIFSSASAKLSDDYEVGLLLDRLDMLRQKYKLAIILIHHSRIPEHSEGETFHYGTDEMFGSSRFPRWLDTIIFVDKVEDNPNTKLVKLTLEFEKSRHTEEKLKPIQVIANRADLTFVGKEVVR